MKTHTLARLSLVLLLALLSACVDDGDSTQDEENEQIDQQVPEEGDPDDTNENEIEG